MNAFAHFGVLLSLVPVIAAGPIDQIPGCTQKGKSYPNLATIPHVNGCGTLQCQFGQFVNYYESCNKDIDGTCHRLNHMFVHDGATYQCIKVPSGDGFEYKYNVTEEKIKDCVYNGKTYQPWEKFVGSNQCQEFQCQNGYSDPMAVVCGKEIDGKCHLVGEKFSKNGKTYTCSKTTANGINVYENVIIPTTGSRTCSAGGKTYANLEVFILAGSCQQRQCQDKTIKILTQACIFKLDGNKCYAEGEEWTFQENRYRCSPNPADGSVKIDTIHKAYAKCKRSEIWYGHLEVQTRSDGCTSVQCQDGATPPVEEGCLYNMDNKCYSLNLVFENKGVLLKCVLTGDGLYRIVEVDNEGKVVEKVPPVTAAPDFGETCPSIAADIIFVWDSSGSISSANYQRQQNFSCDIVRAFKIGPDNVRVGGVVFSKNAEKVFDLDKYDDADSICGAIKKSPFLGDQTETQKAFNMIVEEEMFDEANGGRPDIMDIVIIITDGNSSNTAITLAAANRLKAMGAQMMSIGIGNILEKELLGLASSPKNMFSAKNYEAIFSLRKELSERTCDVPTEPPITPEEPEIKECPQAVADVIFLLDSSLITGVDNFNYMVDLAINISSELVISANQVHVGAALINSKTVNLFNLSKYKTRADVIKAFDSATAAKGGRDTGNALELVLNEGFSAANGGRDKAARIVVISLDGPSTDMNESLKLAKQLRNMGVRVITVGLDDFNLKELIGLSGSRDYVFAAPSQRLLGFVKGDLYQKICEVIKDPRPDPEPPRCTDTYTSPCDHICDNTDTAYTCSCNRGSVVNPKNKTKCDDINECNGKIKLCDQICENTVGSYRCTCKEGYEIDKENPSECNDIDECSKDSCEHFCENTEGSFKCTCKEGYKVSPTDPTKCKDIDECATLTPCQQLCTNTDTGYTCSCKPGYVISATDPNKCDDIDECKKDSPCQQTCTNTDGSYQCSCKPGYVISPTDPTKCDDIDECGTTTPCEIICGDTDNGYACFCKNGHEKDSPCEHLCHNTEGAYTCSCKPGYEVNDEDPTKCDDIDECKKDSPCQQTCTNTDGSYQCSCKPGYVISPTDPTKCDDIDECAKDSPCQHKCTNTDGSYKCSCKPGFVVSPTDPTKCDDVDECKDSPCQQICHNSDGVFECSCKPGYVISPTDPTKCDDVDECLDLVNPPCHHKCKNTDGSYLCSCRDGYEPNTCDPDTCKVI